jgi:CRISPR-associated endoribonuclease Cas6
MGNKLRTALRFFGSGIKYSAICFEALKDYPYKLFSNRGFRFKLEKGRVTEKISLPWEKDWRPVNNDTVPVEMLTPAKLKYRNRQLMPDGPLLHTIIWAAVRRLRSLTEAYGQEYSENREKIDALIDRSDITRVSIRMAEESYVSSVSGKSIDLSGITGWFQTEGPEGIERLLRIAEYVGIGQKTAQGNGRVRIRNPIY